MVEVESTIYDDLHSLKQDAYHLYKLADAFERIGNSKISKELDWRARGIEISTDHIWKYISDVSSQRVHDAMQSSNNMINGVLAGIEIGSKSKGKKGH